MIRLTREGKPNLFIYKHQILTITEKARRPTLRRDKQPETEEPGEDSLE
jgi:host factor-I protein